ncbi:hypothetical protein NQ176_g6166 [Zarea fungicola]|uniref:Uncharacterized protein n=1 Tax=Zarea fungicola TaxID=93591 RepID=A0ACC1N570_9HYPO|nr:hypothetical protein NQ176_g6166 [Lecanicillium fungicola]
MLAAGNVESSCIPPSLMKHANIKPEEVILAQSLLQVSGPSSTLLHDIKFTDAIQRLLPPLVRQVEGNIDPRERLPRLPIPQLQCLQYGRTRTVLQSQESLPDLAGEWLEAIDVEEYLAERGIVLRDDTEGSLVRLRAGSSVSQSQSPEPSIEVGLPMSPSDFSQSSSEPLHMADGGQSEPHDALPTNWMDLYDESDFSDLAMAELDQDLFENMEFHPSDITINFDKLVDGLAARTICLGLCPAIRREGVDEAIREAVVQGNTM